MAKLWLRCAAPAIGLFFLAPIVAEYLLGDLPIYMIAALIVLAPLYGGGALLIREIARRRGLGWTGILILALAYAVFEEAFTTQTLFNPNYLHLNLHLLEPAYIPALGIGGWWTVFVLTLHTVWSISTSVALIEAMVPDRATTPWLGNIGLFVMGTLFIFGAIISTKIEIRQDHFIATKNQFIVSGVVCIALIIIGLLLRQKPIVHTVGWLPSPWIVGVVALAAGSIFLIVPKGWAWRAVAIYLALFIAVAIFVWFASHREGWGNLHRLALAGGAALAYAWHAFLQNPAVGDSNRVVRIGNGVFAAALLLFLFIAARKNSQISVSG